MVLGDLRYVSEPKQRRHKINNTLVIYIIIQKRLNAMEKGNRVGYGGEKEEWLQF